MEEFNDTQLDLKLVKDIPNHYMITDQVVNLVRGYLTTQHSYVGADTTLRILDLGAGSGMLAEKLAKHLVPDWDLSITAVENSVPLLKVLDDRFADSKVVSVSEVNLIERECLSIRQMTIPKSSDVITSIFLTSFLGQLNTQNLFQEVYDNLNKGGMFILVDEMPTMSTKLNEIIRSGFDKADIKSAFANTLGYEGSLVVLPIEFYITHLQAVGFKQIATFYHHNRITGMYCIK